jgi:putative intracellular protease/amidase
MLAQRIAIITYDLHEPYDYPRLWDLLRAEGFDDHVLSEDGRRIKLPMSVWAKTLLAEDLVTSRDLLSAHLTDAIQAAGLSATLLVMVCHGWAWRITNPAATALDSMLSAIFSRHLKSA